jgi:serine phosphatase RsbU (regulator of sigma subunit)
MKTIPTPRGRLAWNLILLNVVLIALAGVLALIPRGDAVAGLVTGEITISVLVTVAWLAAIRFILLDTWGRWFWLACLAGAGTLALTLGEGGMIGAIAISGAVLTFRRYESWRHISARRRASGFGLGIVAVVLVILVLRAWDLDDSEAGARALFKTLSGWSAGSLLIFWIWSLFHLAVRMKLHFLRLRPKLAVSAVLIGLVPLLLVALLGVMILYWSLGGARAIRAENILESWRHTASVGVDLAGAPFDTTFAWPDPSPNALPAADRGQVIPAPAWTEDLSAALNYSLIQVPQSRGEPATTSIDTTGWFLMDSAIWLMDWRGIGTERPTVRAWQLGDQPLTILSELLKAGLHITSVGAEATNGSVEISSPTDEDRERFPGKKVVYRDVSGEKHYWSDFFFFGGTLFEMSMVEDRELHGKTVFLSLRAGWPDLKAEFLEGENNLNIAVMAVLSIFAALFLIIEIFALFFGIRISEGIVSAVHKLHGATRALADGDLETHIDLPNEDEFGDLAFSFNEMTRAVKQGRDDALAREMLTRELANARAIQERLLPSDEPRIAGFQVTGASIPSREIGGDYFDFLIQDNNHLGVAIGDVSGKGMPAALLMANLQASLHGQVLHPSSVSGIVGRVNDLIVKSTDPHMFATFFYGVLDLQAGTLTSTNAGHNPPLVLRNSGELELLGKGGLLLGMLADQPYRQEVTSLEPGEVVVMYTDGITEAVGPSADEDDFEAMFGEEALIDVVRRSSHLPAVGIKEAILDAVAEHTSGVDQSDDITLVVIRRQG